MRVEISVFRCMLRVCQKYDQPLCLTLKKKIEGIERYILQLSKERVTYREIARLTGLINLITQP